MNARPILKTGFRAFLFGLALWLSLLGTRLYHHAQQPIDAVLGLGGSIRREIAIADSVAQGSPLPVLISQGSQPPCIRQLYDRVAAPVDHTWLETCAQSTFDNYRYSVPTLRQWQAHHVQVVTSPSHLPRAAWLAYIMLGSHGLWPELRLVEETGIPGNVEYPLKTVADVGRSLVWAIVSQIFNPPCRDVFPLQSVDLEDWHAIGFTCEHQGHIDAP